MWEMHQHLLNRSQTSLLRSLATFQYTLYRQRQIKAYDFLVRSVTVQRSTLDMLLTNKMMSAGFLTFASSHISRSIVVTPAQPPRLQHKGFSNKNSPWVGKKWIKVASDFKLYAAVTFWFFQILIQIFFSILASPWLSQLQESLTLERSKGCVCFNP